MAKTTKPGAQPDVSVVIVHFETPEDLASCLRALATSTGSATFETIVVDNASRDFQPGRFQGLVSPLEIIQNDRNAGFSVASNLGLRQARGRYVLLLNPDAIVAPNTLSTMVAYMDAHPDVGCSTARLVMDDGTLDLACRRSFPTPQRSLYRLSLLSRAFPHSHRFGQYNLTYLDERQEAEIDSPCGAFMLVRAEVMAKVGLLDERYFMYGEDLDWAWRIKAAGWRITYVPSTTVLHRKRGSSRRNRERTIHAFHDAMRLFYRDHYSEAYPGWVSAAVRGAIGARETIELAGVKLAEGIARARPSAARDPDEREVDASS